MFFLNSQYQIIQTNDIMVIQNRIVNQTKMAFRVNDQVNFSKLQQKLYYGFTEHEADNEENKLAKLLKSKQGHCFSKYTIQKDQAIIRLIRDYTELLADTFISRDLFQLYINKVTDFLNNNLLFKVLTLANDDYSDLVKKLLDIEFIDLSQEHISDEIYDIIIYIGWRKEDTIPTGVQARHVLFINFNEMNVEIGPLVHTDQFTLPPQEYKDTLDCRLLNSDIDIISSFTERILYILFFELYDKTRFNPYFPNRYKLVLNRVDLTIQTVDIPIMPKYLYGNRKSINK